MSDLVVGVLVLPMRTVRMIYSYWPLGEVVCMVWLVIDDSVCSISILNLCLIAHNRYIALTQPFQSHANPPGRGLIAGQILAAWLCGFAIWIPAHIFLRDPEPSMECTYLPDGKYIIILSVVALHVPILAMLYFYCMCLVALHKHNKKIVLLTCSGFTANRQRQGELPAEANPPGSPLHGRQGSLTFRLSFQTEPRTTDDVAIHVIGGSDVIGSSAIEHNEPRRPDTTDERSSSEREQQVSGLRRRQRDHARSLRSLAVIMLALMLCLWPWYILWPMQSLCGGCIDSTFDRWAALIVYVNSAVNPVLYFICNSEFRAAFRETFGKMYNANCI